MCSETNVRSLIARYVLTATLISAALVTSFRFLHIADLDYDLTIQIQAAQMLVDGKGLVVFSAEPWGKNDVLQPMNLHYLTWFSSGYSLYAAVLIALGVKLGLIVKIFGASLTMVGWWGWGRLASSFWAAELGRGVFWKVSGLAIAIVTPVFFTPPWYGTDIFLWALLPWITYWLTKTADGLSWRGLRYYGLAGAVCGLCVLMRYASLFLVVGCLLVIFGQTMKRWQLMVGRWGAFMIGLVGTTWVQFALVPQLGRPGGIQFGINLQQIFGRAMEGLHQLSSVSQAIFFWAPEPVRKALTAPVSSIPWQLGVAVIVLILPLIVVWRCGARTTEEALSDFRVVTSLMVPVLAAVLLGCMVFGSYGYLNDSRYYWPVAPLAFYVPLFLAVPREEPRGRPLWIFQSVNLVLVLALIAGGVFRLASLFFSGVYGDGQRQLVAGTRMSRPWPSMALNYETYQPRNYVAEYLRQHPGTFLITTYESWFYADSSIDTSRLIRLIFFEHWSGITLVGPARLLLMVPDNGVPGDVVLGWRSQTPRIVPLNQLPNAKIHKVFPGWKIKIIEVEVPANERLRLDGSGRKDDDGKPGGGI